MKGRIFESYNLILSLRIVKFFYDAGVFEKVMQGTTWIGENDYIELFLNGMSALAPVFKQEELGEEVCCG